MILLQGAELIWKRDANIWTCIIKHGGDSYVLGLSPSEAIELANHILQMEKDLVEVKTKGTLQGRKVIAKTEFIKAVDSPKK